MEERKTDTGEIYTDEKKDFDKVVKKKKSSGRRNKIIAALAVAAVVVLGVYFCFDKLFVFKKLVMVDAVTKKEITVPYTEEQLLDGMGIEKGMKLYGREGKEIASNAKYNLTYIKDMKISRKLPNTIVAEVTLAKEMFYFSINETIYIVSEDLVVLDSGRNIDEKRLDNLILLRCSSIRKCIKGEKLVLDEEIESILLELTDVLETEKSLGNIKMIDVYDKFDITLHHGTKFIVKLGDFKDFSNKIKMMNEIIKDKEGTTANGTIDVTKDYGKTGTLKKF